LFEGHPSPVKEDVKVAEQDQHVKIIDNRTSLVADPTMSQRMWASHVDAYRQHSIAPYDEINGISEVEEEEESKCRFVRELFKYWVHWPLTVPRRLTIPLVEAEGWSKFYTVCSATFAPTLLAMVWDGRDKGGFGSAWRGVLCFWGCWDYIWRLVIEVSWRRSSSQEV
jgi:hypothetical protein